MSHTLDKDPSAKEKQPSETTCQTCCKCLNHPKTDGQHRMKRLKTLRDRRQMRSGGKNAAKTKSHHHHCCRQARIDTAHSCNCCHGGCNPTRDPLFAKVVPAAQEPSIITDHRLIGHHGLFNHEVKSVDIERLLSEQRKMDNTQEKTHKENPNLSHPSPPSCGNAFVDDEAAENLPFEDKKEPSSDTSADCHEIQEKISRGSDLTPAQRPHQQRHRSPDSYRSIFSSKHSFLDVVISTDKKKVHSVTREKDKESPLSLTLHDVETPVTPENKAPAAPQTHTCGVSPSSPPLSSFGSQHRGEDPACVSFITATAARLCDSLQLPRLWRRDLLAESRERLLMVLRARRGPWLQENLLTEQQHVSFGLESTMTDGDEVLSAVVD
uniref:uncharacterized protein si:dkey-250k15.4 n=1 Tax=Solea senegalensis TaxID=28829 RepID=UPI001CD83869|nr:uncharacterized protein si:dkey-250k15.4 [Solea senegalensis]